MLSFLQFHGCHPVGKRAAGWPLSVLNQGIRTDLFSITTRRAPSEVGMICSTAP